MKRRVLAILTAAAALGFAGGALAQTSGGAMVGTAPGVAAAARTVTATATVSAIDMTTRQVTLRGAQGREFVVVAGDEVRNLA